MAQPATKLLLRHSQIVTMVSDWDHDKDYTHRVTLYDHVSARWSHLCQFLTLTSLWDSHSLPTRHSRESLMHQTPIGGFFSHSILQFSYFCFLTSAFSTCPSNVRLLDAISSTQSFSVLLPAVETSNTTQTVHVLAWWPSSVVITCACVPYASCSYYRGWPFFCSELPIVQLLFEASDYLRQYLFKEVC